MPDPKRSNYAERDAAVCATIATEKWQNPSAYVPPWRVLMADEETDAQTIIHDYLGMDRLAVDIRVFLDFVVDARNGLIDGLAKGST